jgi:hypothetical protein
MSKGWIMLHRSIQDCYLWKDKPFSKGAAWVDLLLLVNHKDNKCLIDGELRTIERGQLVTSIATLSERWGWDRRKTSKFLKVLETDNMITQKRTTHGTTVTIVNYGVYQDSCTTECTTECTTDVQPNAQPMHNHCTTECTTDVQPNVQPLPTNNNVKNIKNDKNVKNEKNVKNTYYPADEKLNAAFVDFVDMRKKIKKPMTDRAIDLAIKKLEELATDSAGNMDNDLAIQIVNQSVLRSWQTFYPLKDDSRGGKHGGRDLMQELMDC